MNSNQGKVPAETPQQNNETSKEFRDLKPKLIILLVMGGFGVMGGGLLAPALPSLIEHFGIDEATVGLVLGIYTFAAALSLPFTGFLIDLLGRRITGIGCLLIDGLFGLLCTTAPNFTILLLFRFFQGIGIAGLIPVAMTVISDWYQGSKRLKVIGFLSGTVSLSAVVVPFLGGVLAGIDWRYPFLVYGLSLILALLFFLFIPESQSEHISELLAVKAAKHLSSLRSALKLDEVKQVFKDCLVLYFMLYAAITFLPLFLSGEYKLPDLFIGLAISITGFMGALVASQSVRINQIFKEGPKLFTGFILIGLSMVFIPIWLHGYQLVISLILFGTGMGIIQPAIYNRATTAGPEQLTGSIISLFNTVKFIGMTLAPVLLRFVYHYWSLEGVFFSTGLLAAAWALLSLVGTEE